MYKDGFVENVGAKGKQKKAPRVKNAEQLKQFARTKLGNNNKKEEADNSEKEENKPSKSVSNVLGAVNSMMVEDSNLHGGWGDTNSVQPLMQFLNNWSIPMEIPCLEIGENTRTTKRMFKHELRIVINLVKNDQIAMVHELFSYGKDAGKKVSKGRCAGSMRRS